MAKDLEFSEEKPCGHCNREVPILESLSLAILEYVYSAPYLAEQAEMALGQLKQKSAK